MVRNVRAGIFRLARTRLLGGLIRLGIRYMSFIIPVERLRETPHLMAFYHPRPSYPVHILIVPKHAYASLLELPAGDSDFMRDLISTVQSLVCELHLEQVGYRLITNGGAYQDVPVLHFHLISENERRTKDTHD